MISLKVIVREVLADELAKMSLPKMPIANLMEPGSDGFATVMEPPDRQGHGATS